VERSGKVGKGGEGERWGKVGKGGKVVSISFSTDPKFFQQ
jgi:hypothetical protein